MTAAAGARRDLDDWRRLLEACERICPDAVEIEVTGFDPLPDLNRRGRWWSHRFPSAAVTDVVAFGAALAQAEKSAWEAGDGVTATRAFEDRRFLLGDRVVHWLVPYSFVIADGEPIRRIVLEIGDRIRPAPLLTATEGLDPPGEDAFGPLAAPLRIELGSPERWLRLADDHPGTARLWKDLARRAG